MGYLILFVTLVLVGLGAIAELGPFVLTQGEMQLVQDVGLPVTVIWIALVLIAGLRFIVNMLYDWSSK